MAVRKYWVFRPATWGTLDLSSAFLSLFLLRCQWVCSWLPSLRPQLRVYQLAWKLQVWVPEWLRVCRWLAHLRRWVLRRFSLWPKWCWPLLFDSLMFPLRPTEVLPCGFRKQFNTEITQGYGSVQPCVVVFLQTDTFGVELLKGVHRIGFPVCLGIWPNHVTRPWTSNATSSR